MFRRISILLGLALVLLIGSVLQVSADAIVTSYFPGCSSFTASGTTDADFVAVEVYDPDTGNDLFYDTFPASDGTFSFTATFATQEIGHMIQYYVWGATTSDPDDWDGSENYFNVGDDQTPCQQEPAGKQLGAPGIPSGFVFASIICNTPVYNTPAGQPVGDAAVTAGQTWYVNPTPVNGDDGKQWTEIYVSSTTNPFIPTACVQ